MRLERHDGHRVLVGGPVPPQAGAITLGRTVIVRDRCADDKHLMAHELVHVDQYKRLGWLRFTARYLGAYLKARLAGHGHMAAYRRIPLEVEASWVSRHRSVADGAGSGGADADPAACEAPSTGRLGNKLGDVRSSEADRATEVVGG